MRNVKDVQLLEGNEGNPYEAVIKDSNGVDKTVSVKDLAPFFSTTRSI